MPPSSINTIKASTQEHLEIEDIIDDIVLLKSGSCSLIIQVTAINFNLLSETEQDAIIYAYAGLLNSLTFPIQIMVRSNIKDVSDYIRLIKKQENNLKKPLLLNQLKKYRQFIESTVRENQVLDKKFYIIIPFDRYELGLPNPLPTAKKPQTLPYPKGYILERAKMNLYPKRDHLLRQFGRLGLQSRQLNTQQLLELLYNIYNQESVGQKLTNPKEYSTPIVQPSIGKNSQGSRNHTPAQSHPQSNPHQQNQPIPPQTQPSQPTPVNQTPIQQTSQPTNPVFNYSSPNN